MPLLTLPEELLQEIVAQLSAAELFAVAQVCRRLSAASQNHPVWRALCVARWGGDFGLFEMTFEGSFDDDGEASGTFTTGTLYGSETGEVLGNIDGSEIELSANFRVWGFGEVEAFFKTE